MKTGNSAAGSDPIHREQAVKDRKRKMRMQRFSRIVFFLAAFFVIVSFIPIFSQSQKPPKPPEKKSVPARHPETVKKPGEKAPSKTKYKNVGLKADHMRFNNKTKNLFAEKNVVLTMKEKDGDMKILCEKLLYNTEAETAKITGSPVFTQPGTTIVGDVLHANFKEKKLRIENNVQVDQEKKAIKRETGLKEHLKDKFTLTCDFMNYDYGIKKGTAEGNIKIVQKSIKDGKEEIETTAYGDKADYDGKTEILVVTGRVKIEQKDGEWLNAQKATISLKEDWVEIEGEVSGTFKIEEEKIPDTKL